MVAATISRQLEIEISGRSMHQHPASLKIYDHTLWGVWHYFACYGHLVKSIKLRPLSPRLPPRAACLIFMRPQLASRMLTVQPATGW